MTKQQALKLFEEKKVRTVWDDCHQLKMQAVDGKMNLKINSKIIQ